MDFSQIKNGLAVYVKSQAEMSSSLGEPVGTVDHLDGEHYIKLAKKDAPDARHHWVPVRWVERIDDHAVYLNKTAEEFRQGQFDEFPGVIEEREAI